MTTLYGHRISGSSHRVRLMLELLGMPHRYVEIDLAAGDHRRPDFLALNPFGQVPVLQDAGRTLRDSHGILVYLARSHGRAWHPDEPVVMAEIQAWLSFSAGEIQHSLGRLHLARLHAAEQVESGAERRARDALRLVNHQLAQGDRSFLVAGPRPTIADVALYPYVSLAAPEHPDLAHLARWIEALEARHGFVRLPAPAAAA